MQSVDMEPRGWGVCNGESISVRVEPVAWFLRRHACTGRAPWRVRSRGCGIPEVDCHRRCCENLELPAEHDERTAFGTAPPRMLSRPGSPWLMVSVCMMCLPCWDVEMLDCFVFSS